jgi:uncharacterized protein
MFFISKNNLSITFMKTICILLITALMLVVKPVEMKSQNQFEVMVYTSPDRWHNRTIPVAISGFQEMALRHSFGLTWTQLPGSFNDDNLDRFDVIVFLQANGRELSANEMESLKRFIRNGGGFVGIHGTSILNEKYEWFRKLVGRVFIHHPAIQTAVMHVVDKGHPSTMHLPGKWLWTDEWYSFGESLTDNQKVLITVDESTYNIDWPQGEDTGVSDNNNFHPISWYQEYDGGRSFYTALGHMPSLFKDKTFLDHIYGGIFWAATGLGVTD